MAETFEEADIGIVREIAQDVMSEVGRIVVGLGDILQYLFIGLMTNGHILLEGVPGLAKTVTAKTFAEALGITFNRIQFTPDLLPSDCTGSMVFDQSKGDFVNPFVRTFGVEGNIGVPGKIING